MSERSPSHNEFTYTPEELGLNMGLAEDAQLYNESDGVRSIGHLLLSLRQVRAMHREGEIDEEDYSRQLDAHYTLIEDLRLLYRQT